MHIQYYGETKSNIPNQYHTRTFKRLCRKQKTITHNVTDIQFTHLDEYDE